MYTGNEEDFNKALDKHYPVTENFLQDAVDLAIKYDRTVSFRHFQTSEDFRKVVVPIDSKGCLFFGGDGKDPYVTEITPPSIQKYIGVPDALYINTVEF